MKGEMLVVQMEDLPRLVQVVTESGQGKVYQLVPAGRKKVGAALQKADLPADVLEHVPKITLK